MSTRSHPSSGFTLIELLVIIIIIGILASIALPSFLNQASRAREAEAKTYIGALNRGQQAYFLEKSSFAATLSDLELGIPETTDNYTYTIALPNELEAAAIATPTGVLNPFSGLVFIDDTVGDRLTLARLCNKTAVPTRECT